MTEKQEKFLTTYRQVCNITHACRALRFSENEVSRWKKEDPDFKQAMDAAKKDAKEERDARNVPRDLPLPSVITCAMWEAIEDEESKLVDILKENGTYKQSYNPQIRNAAIMCVSRDIMALRALECGQLFEKGPKEAVPSIAWKMLMQATEAAQRALKELGITNESKERKDTGDEPGILDGIEFE